MATLKYSRQREAIKNFLMTRQDHPTADSVYLHIREEYPNISLGTVYRNLSLLSELGEIQKICTGGADHFDGNPENHYHFVCRNCHAVIDVPAFSMPAIEEEAGKDFSGQIEGHSIQFTGLCEACMKEI